MAHDRFLAYKILQGFRPQFKNYHVPPLLMDIIEKCWDSDPLKRPSTPDVRKEIRQLFVDKDYDDRARDDKSEISEISKQCAQVDKLNKQNEQNNSTGS